MTTLKDVARLAGVSSKTVSRVVNQDPNVAAETRETVTRLVAELGYVPNDAARLMRTQSSRVIGFMTDVIATTPYSVDIVRGVQSELRKAGRTALIANSDGDARIEADYWQQFRAQRVAGAIFATMFHRRIEIGTLAFQNPIVLVNGYDEDGRYPAVLPDDEGGGYRQAEYLLALGHRRIGAITLHRDLRATELRTAGFRAAMAASGAAVDESLIRSGADGPLQSERRIAFEVGLELLSQPDRPTAIVCGHDETAMHVMGAAYELGIRVPSDLSLIGFDDFRMISESLRPTLTTVALPYFEMGRKAIQILDDCLAGKDVPRRPILVDCPLVERHSCAPPRPSSHAAG